MLPEEKRRLKKLTRFETAAYKQGYTIIAGIDEAGRGPLAGPVVAAACIISKGTYIEDVNDSKQLCPAKRERIYKVLVKHPEVAYAIGIVDSKEIDRVNILQATIKAMICAVNQLNPPPNFLLVDGMQIPHPIPSQKIVKGDALSQSIAAASILAKVTRDLIMEEFDVQWPLYGFKAHKGYGTEEHLKALKHHGPCPIHRLTYAPMQLSKVEA